MTTPTVWPGSPTITPTVANHVLYYHQAGGYPPGGFITALLEAWHRADWGNAARLRTAFPAYGAALSLAQQPDGIRQLHAIADKERP